MLQMQQEMHQTQEIIMKKMQAPLTLRKLPIFGKPESGTKFEWPTPNEIGVVFDKPIKVVSIKYRAR